jgi:RimJ/RimL family protein N-acetyltransferase
MSNVVTSFSGSSTVLLSQSQSLNDYVWEETIHGDGLSMHLVTKEKNDFFQAICKMYQLEEQQLEEGLESMVLWCIYDEKNCPIGIIQIDHYASLEALKVQVSDPALASQLFSKQKVLELSYTLDENNRGRGLGSKSVQTWLNYARQNAWSSSLFAVVDVENKASIRILEKNSLAYLGEYVHSETKEQISVYVVKD